MSFTRLNIRTRYRSSDDDIVNDFYVPVLRYACLYKRAVGFFSSSALIQVSRGISGLVSNHGKILLVASPILHPDDVNAINKGYKDREAVITRRIVESLKEPEDHFQEERLNMLAHLIADGFLDIKIAFFQDNGRVGLYHEKIGIVYDQEGNRIAFTGSLNESSTAFLDNFESIDVFCSWKNQESLERVNEKEDDFDRLWDNRTRKIAVIDFPSIAREKLNSYKKHVVDWDMDTRQYVLFPDLKRYSKLHPSIPDTVRLYPYQQEAVDNWEKSEFRGIFSMATGTGKTYTALAATAKLFERRRRLVVVIVCPYQHLVEQWVEDIRRFNMEPIIGYSSSLQSDWKNRLKEAVIDYQLGVIEHFCLVTTNATFCTPFVQNQIREVNNETLLVVDEAHNFGAEGLSSNLDDGIAYRLALSATIERHGDPEGTEKLYQYFGRECFVYSLDQAIREGKLCNYYYYPVLTHLTGDELAIYRQLSIQMAGCLVTNKLGQKTLNDAGKKLAIKRARLVAGAVNKLTALMDVMTEYKDKSHILVYCGATTILDPGYVEGQVDESERRQIMAVSDLLGNKLGMKVAQFTSREDPREREVLKREFSKGDNLQVLIAIRCLDEGVNIPGIRTAFILASSTNPKEYVQRRGRVLRLSPGKSYSEIYDFVTIPRPLEEVSSLPEAETRTDISLVRKELSRIKDFADLSLNPQTGCELATRLEEAYGLDRVKGTQAGD